MGCNCGKGKDTKTSTGKTSAGQTGQTATFALQTPDGRTLTYGSRLERDAARVRLGGAVLRSD